MPKTLPIHFAPLQGYTEVFYRNAHAACFGGIDTYYTPFVRLEKGGFRHRDVRGIEPGNNQVAHLIPQLIAPSFEKAEKSSVFKNHLDCGKPSSSCGRNHCLLFLGLALRGLSPTGFPQRLLAV